MEETISDEDELRPPYTEQLLSQSVHKTSLAVGFASIRQRGWQMLQCQSIALSSSMHATPRHRLIINLT